MNAERVLFVHAHPDDESIATGGTIATLTARGAEVTVVTCTRGELGEVVSPDLEGLPLDEVRERELEAAMRTLGVRDHRWLGEPGARLPGTAPRRYRDSGMRWAADGRAAPVDDVAPDALTAAEFADVAADIATVIADVRPDAVVSYDDAGGYGHPDHVLVARAARRAADVMVVPYWSIASDGEAGLEVDVVPVLARKRAALEAYRSQLVVDGDRFAGANGRWEPVASTERFRREPAEAPTAEAGYETFAEQGVVSRIFVLGVSLVLGALAGLVLTAAHRDEIAGIPWAALLELVLVAALLVGLRIAFGSRLPPLAAGIGVIGASIVLAMPSAGGAILVQADLPGYLWMFGLPVVVFAVLVRPRGGFRRTGRIERVVVQEGPPAP